MPLGKDTNIARNVGSSATTIGMINAQETAMGNRNPSSQVQKSLRKMQPNNPQINKLPEGMMPRGSSAGLKAEKSAYLMPAKSGYYNPEIHRARRTKPQFSRPNVNLRDTINMKNIAHCTFDSRLCRVKGSSIDLLLKKIL